MKVLNRILHAWNAFNSREGPDIQRGQWGTYPLHRARSGTGMFTKSHFTGAIYNRIALDVANTDFQFVKVNPKNDDHEPQLSSSIHKLFNVEANIDQSSLAFIQDLVYSLFDEGVVAVIPTHTTLNPETGYGFDIDSACVCEILEWYPESIKVKAYNPEKGKHEDVVIRKKAALIIENPLYAVVNGKNSTLSRLMNKMSMVDDIDAIMASGRLDVIIQLPHAVKNDTRRKLANERLQQMEEDLKNGTNGISYIDATEKVIQLNRPANTQLMENVKLLKDEFYNQLGMTENVMNGTASETEMRLYYTRTIDPIVKVILAEVNRKWVSPKARSLGYKLEAYRSNIGLASVESLGNLIDTLRRNSIITGNEGRRMLGYRPHTDPSADTLMNPNMPMSEQPGVPMGDPNSQPQEDPLQTSFEEVLKNQNG